MALPASPFSPWGWKIEFYHRLPKLGELVDGLPSKEEEQQAGCSPEARLTTERPLGGWGFLGQPCYGTNIILVIEMGRGHKLHWALKE